MTDKDNIRAEIERELSAHDKVDHFEAFEVEKAWNRGHRRALEDILSFIDSLPGEAAPKESDDLDEAAEEYALNCVCAGPYNSIGKYGFMAGAIWQQLKMMEGAVEGEITKDIHNLLHVKSGPLPMPSEFKFGDKVKIIILRNDERTPHNMD